MSPSDWKAVFDALGNRYRRRLLVSLLEHNPQRDEVNVPEDVHAGEKELTILQAEMFHNHLPQLEAAGFVRWDRDAHEVVKGPRFEEIRPVLELLHRHADELPDGWL